MTNREVLNNMSDKELASFFRMFDCPPDCADEGSDIGCVDSCTDCWVRWMKKEATKYAELHEEDQGAAAIADETPQKP